MRNTLKEFAKKIHSVSEPLDSIAIINKEDI